MDYLGWKKTLSPKFGPIFLNLEKISNFESM
jgi:hypothetical protein